MDKMSEADERRIFKAVEKAIGLVNDGSTPDDAIYKVASDGRFMPQVVQRMVESYNQSKTLSHIQNSSSEEKAANFPIANSTKILERMYPDSVTPPAEKQAAEFRPDFYGRRETINFNKVAAPVVQIPRLKVTQYSPDVRDLENRAWNKRAGLSKKAEYAKGNARFKFYELTKLAEEAGQYFNMVYHKPFAEVETQMIRHHGQLGKSAMDMVYHFGQLREARSAEKVSNGSGQVKAAWFVRSQEPYPAIANLIDASIKFHKLASEYGQAANELEDFEKTSGAAIPEKRGPELPLDSFLGSRVKEASGLVPGGDTLQRAGGLGLSLLGINPAKSEDSARRSAVSEVYDPIHESKLQGIKMQAVLNDLLSNDEFLSGHDIDPHQVTTAYNQLAELVPSVAQQPVLVRGLLRHIVNQKGVMEPFEAQQATQIEKHLRGVNTPDSASGQPAVKQ